MVLKGSGFMVPVQGYYSPRRALKGLEVFRLHVLAPLRVLWGLGLFYSYRACVMHKSLGMVPHLAASKGLC